MFSELCPIYIIIMSHLRKQLDIFREQNLMTPCIYANECAIQSVGETLTDCITMFLTFSMMTRLRAKSYQMGVCDLTFVHFWVLKIRTFEN